MSSPESARPHPAETLDRLPSALPAMWRALKRGYQAEPRLIVVAFSLSLLAALPDALFALWLMLLADGGIEGDRTLLTIAAVGLGASATSTWFLHVVSDRTQRRFRDRVTIHLESHVAELQASVATVAHHERPEYLDRLAVLRDQVFVLDHMYMSLFDTAGWILRLGITIGLLVSIHPALATLALFALPTVLASTWRPPSNEPSKSVERLTVASHVTSSNSLPRRHLAKKSASLASATTSPASVVKPSNAGTAPSPAHAGPVPSGTPSPGRSSALASSAWSSS